MTSPMTAHIREDEDAAGYRPPDLPLFLDYLLFAPLSRALIRSREAALLLPRFPNGRILDLGHGDGRFAALLEKNGKRFFAAIDRSFEELQRARSRTSPHLVVADMTRLPFRDGTFQGAVSNCVLEHVDDIDTALLETARVLIPGGPFLATTISDHYEPLLFWARLLRIIRLDPLRRFYLSFLRKTFHHVHQDPPAAWTRRLEKQGFDVTGLVAYVGKRRQMLMDLFLPFVLLSRLLERLLGSAVLFPRRWHLPAPAILRWVSSDPAESDIRASANLLLVARRKPLDLP